MVEYKLRIKNPQTLGIKGVWISRFNGFCKHKMVMINLNMRKLNAIY